MVILISQNWQKLNKNRKYAKIWILDMKLFHQEVGEHIIQYVAKRNIWNHFKEGQVTNAPTTLSRNCTIVHVKLQQPLFCCLPTGCIVCKWSKVCCKSDLRNACDCTSVFRISVVYCAEVQFALFLEIVDRLNVMVKVFVFMCSRF